MIWDPFQAAAERQIGARVLADGRGVVSNHAFFLAEKEYASKRPEVIGFDEVMKIPTTRVESVAPLAMEVLQRSHDRPLFLSVGFFETHREFLGPGSLRDVHYSQPPANLPDAPEVRADVAAFKASARSLVADSAEPKLGLTERRRSRTDRAVGYTTAQVLKTCWATGPMPLRRGA